MYKVSFSGYRPGKMDFFGEDDPLCVELKERIFSTIKKLYDEGARDFYSGMALGVDTWCAEAVLELKRLHPEITLTAVIPYPGQDERWRPEDKRRYRDLLSACDKTICVSDSYSDQCMYKRNRALVDLCDVLVAVYDGKRGGTQYTVNYAKRQHKRIIMFPPI